MYNVSLSIEFNTVVNNVNAIAREYRHAIDTPVKEDLNELTKFTKFMDDVNFKMDFETNQEGYVYGKMLDAMDYIMDYYLSKYDKSSFTYRTWNSIYDVIREFYFAYEA